MNKARLTWIIFPAVSVLGLGLLLSGHQLMLVAKQTLIAVANGCRDLIHAGPADYLSLLQLNGVSFSAAFWLIGGGILLFVGGSGVYAIYRNWEFFSILDYYCNLLAESAVQFSSNWAIRLLVWPIRVCFVFLALIFILVHCFRDQRRRLPERIEAELVENDLSTIEV